jgi:16S rRNA (guanine966-N2)-methyltransferase
MLTIISGKHRGRKIETKRSAAIRPTGGKARGAIFNILMHGEFSAAECSPLIGKCAIDLFCGTGALGLEALSRGAEHVTFVDQSSESIALAAANVRNLKEEGSAHFLRNDSAALPPARKSCSLAFLDPPYNSGLAAKSLASLDRQGWLEDTAIAVIELSHKEQFAPPEHYTLFDERRYGNTRIVFVRYGKVSE